MGGPGPGAQTHVSPSGGEGGGGTRSIHDGGIRQSFILGTQKNT